MTSNFRQFTNEINKGGMPTFENFQKQYVKPVLSTPSKAFNGAIALDKLEPGWREKESALWHQRFSDLKKKVVEQRKEIKRMDSSLEKKR